MSYSGFDSLIERAPIHASTIGLVHCYCLLDLNDICCVLCCPTRWLFDYFVNLLLLLLLLYV